MSDPTPDKSAPCQQQRPPATVNLPAGALVYYNNVLVGRTTGVTLQHGTLEVTVQAPLSEAKP